MFSGELPFEGLNILEVGPEVRQGRRPSRPFHDLSRRRGLNDQIWDLINVCWTREPRDRPTAKKIVQKLRALRPLDERPPDISSMSGIFYETKDNPFSLLDIPSNSAVKSYQQTRDFAVDYSRLVSTSRS
jgi:hypothetical protein